MRRTGGKEAGKGRQEGEKTTRVNYIVQVSLPQIKMDDFGRDARL